MTLRSGSSASSSVPSPSGRGEHGVNRGYYDFAVFIIREHEYEIKFVYVACCFRTTDIQKAFSFLFLERIWTIRESFGSTV